MKVGFIGCGKMGEAILADLLRAGRVDAGAVCVCESDGDRRTALITRYKVDAVCDYGPVLAGSDIVFLGVKPQALDSVLTSIAPEAGPRILFISIAAGKRLAHMERLLPGARVVRVMPNLATLVSEGMSVFCMGKRAVENDRTHVVELLSCFGKVLELPERHFDAVTALSGSGPAFFAYFLKQMSEAGAALGLDGASASRLAVQTMLGTSKLIAQEAFDVDGLIAAVSSARGTTVAGMAVLAYSDIGAIVRQTLQAAAKRSEELSR